ncbi:MAG TPA: isoprenylcysteine carboxylmethyltransferase family protein [Hyphomicrobiales bacterium]|nr:isoprenylcysteine carboxylmethyltransferase family protein [Hyphomicrobiales bacterium]
MSPGKDTAGVLLPPPVIFLAGLAIGLAAEWLWPAPLLPQTLQYAVGISLMALSAVIAALGFREFFRHRTPVEPYKPTESIITSGPFRYSRNPLYLSLTLLYAGTAFAVDGVWIAVLLVPVLILLHDGVILREEAYLERKFPDVYPAYKARVRRWL